MTVEQYRGDVIIDGDVRPYDDFQDQDSQDDTVSLPPLRLQDDRFIAEAAQRLALAQRTPETPPEVSVSDEPEIQVEPHTEAYLKAEAILQEGVELSRGWGTPKVKVDGSLDGMGHYLYTLSKNGEMTKAELDDLTKRFGAAIEEHYNARGITARPERRAPSSRPSFSSAQAPQPTDSKPREEVDFAKRAAHDYE